MVLPTVKSRNNVQGLAILLSLAKILGIGAT